MKKIFAFAIALVSMAAVMTSCNNDETDYIMQPTPRYDSYDAAPKKIEFDGNIYIAATADQQQYVNSILTVIVDGESKEVNLYDLPVANTIPFSIQKGLPKSKPMPTFYVYQIPANTKGELKVNAALSIKEGVELPETIDISLGAATEVSGTISIMSGLMKVKADSYLALRSNSPFLNTTL